MNFGLGHLSAGVPRAMVLLALACGGCGALQNNAAVTTLESPAVAPQPSVSARPGLRDLTESEKTLLAESLSAGVDDPESVQFKWSKIAPLRPSGRQAFDYCAEVNVKNENGTYRGFRTFRATIVAENGAIVGGSIGAIADEKPESKDVVRKVCRQNGLS